MLQFVYYKNFKKVYKKLPTKIERAVKQRLRLFALSPFDAVLNNHPLRGKYLGCRSINITGNFRLVYSEESDNVVVLVDVGTHSQLYG